MQTEMEDKYPEVVNFKKMGEGLKKILGDECEASERVDEQVTDFMGCWSTLADDIQGKIRKVSVQILLYCLPLFLPIEVSS
jgi:archaellum component FlaC